jgi:hydroxyacylglutathione hydrolase
MFFAQYYLDCLSQASYLIADEATGKAVVVDPRRDIGEYLAEAAARGFTVELVLNTHFHADFLSGHLELAAATGAAIAYGEAADAEFPIRKLADGERISLGDVTLEILHTPGHTPESISIVVYEHADDEVPYGVLTGDTLFIGDVGRPDLLASIGVTADELARSLYSSLHDKLLLLPDATRVYPAHGAGSACGKNLSTETQSTMGEQRRTNYALQPMDLETFVAVVTEGQPAAPGYFVYDAILNRKDRPIYDEGKAPDPLTIDDVLAAQADGAVVLDVRDPAEFAAAHLADAINVGADGRFAEYAGTVVAPDTPIVVVAPHGREDEAAMRLARIGFDTVVGYLHDAEVAFIDHPDVVVHSSRVTAVQLAEASHDPVAPVVVDVRNPGEREVGSIPGSLHIPLAQLPSRLEELPMDRPVVVHCAGGYRSMIASSLLERAGFADVSDLLGGYAAWVETVATAS